MPQISMTFANAHTLFNLQMKWRLGPSIQSRWTTRPKSQRTHVSFDMQSKRQRGFI